MKSEDKVLSDRFITPENYETIKKANLSGPNGWLLFVACNSGIELAESVKKDYDAMLRECSSKLKKIPLLGTRDKPITTIFEDTETCPRLNKYVAGSSVYVFQCIHEHISGNTVNENIQQLLQVIRTLRAHRAKTITVITPYSPYSRQDKPTFMKREATLASLFADQLKSAGADICVTYHPHSYSLYGFYEPDMLFVALSGMDLLIDVFEDKVGKDDVIVVSTDAGGSKFTILYSDVMDLTYAISSKFRSDKDRSIHLGITGDFKNKTKAIITDDETVTGGSVIKAIKSLYNDHGIEEIYVGISHLKITEDHIGRFVEAYEKYGLKELHVTDSIPQTDAVIKHDFIHVHSLSKRFASVVNRLQYNKSISKLSKYDLVNS